MRVSFALNAALTTSLLLGACNSSSNNDDHGPGDPGGGGSGSELDLTAGTWRIELVGPEVPTQDISLSNRSLARVGDHYALTFYDSLGPSKLAIEGEDGWTVSDLARTYGRPGVDAAGDNLLLAYDGEWPDHSVYLARGPLGSLGAAVNLTPTTDGERPTVATGSNGQLAIAYTDPATGNQQIGRVNPVLGGADGALVVEHELGTGFGCGDTDLRFDDAGHLHAVTGCSVAEDGNNWEIFYATDASGSWVTEQLSSGPIWDEGPVLALDGDVVHLAFAVRDRANVAPDQVMYARRDPSGWSSPEEVWHSTKRGHGFPWPTITVDDAGRPLIAFADVRQTDTSQRPNQGDIRMTWPDADGWVDPIILTDATEPGDHSFAMPSSLQIDPDTGGPIMAVDKEHPAVWSNPVVLRFIPGDGPVE